MPLIEENNFIQEILSTSQKGCLMGLDVGSKRIGVALSDSTWTIAYPLETIERTTFAHVLKHLKKTIEDFTVIGIVVGLPLNMNGTEGKTVQSTRHFVYNLMKEISLPTLLWDERLSTVSAEKTLLEANLSRAKRTSLKDKVAAAIILQGFLEKLLSIRKKGLP